MNEWHGLRHLTVVERLDELVASKPDTLCARMGSWQRTYGEMGQCSIEIAKHLHAIGATAGSRVATLAPNRAELIDLFFGLARLGAVQVPVNPFLRGGFLKHQLSDCAASVVITDAQGWAALAPLLSELPSVHSVVLLDPALEAVDAPVTLFDYAAMPSAEFPDPELQASSRMSIVYTSGTTVRNPRRWAPVHDAQVPPAGLR